MQISVIVPTRNRADLLPRSLDSILRQTHEDYELIIVDDGSTDHTKEVIRRYQDTRIRHINNDGPLHGASCARNIGIRAARGNYISFHDSDDVCAPTKLERQLGFLQEHQADIVFCQMHKADTGECIPPNGLTDWSLPAILKRSLAGTPAIFGRAECFRENLFDEMLTRNVDWELMIRLTGTCRVVYQEEDLLEIHATPGSISTDSEAAVQSLEYIRDKHKDQYDRHPKSRDSLERLILYQRALLEEERSKRALKEEETVRNLCVYVRDKVQRKAAGAKLAVPDDTSRSPE